MASPNTRDKIINGVLTAVVIGLLGLNAWWFLSQKSTTSDHPLMGQAAPEFGLPLLASNGQPGSTLKLSDQRGKVVLLDFWATYCGPCKKQMPILEEVHKSLPADRFTIISINTDNPRQQDRLEQVSSFVQRGGYTFPIVLDTGRASSDYKIRRIPTLIMVGPDGTIHQAHTGLWSRDDLMKQVQTLLDAPSSTSSDS